MKAFDINFLDHVAIRVKDINISVQWYEKVLGLKPMILPGWGDFPVFMSCGKAGVAIFPANLSDPETDKRSKNTGISHFAFNVTNKDFEKAQGHFNQTGQPFEFQDHTYFHSIYITDPDGHTVELTTLVVKEDSFYK